MRFVTPVVVLAASVAASAALAAPRAWVIDPGLSSVRVQVGKAGMFKFAGHEHQVVATRLGGQVEGDPDALTGSKVTVEVDPAGLRVDAAREPSGDAPKVQETMLGPRVLDVTRFPGLRFSSTAVRGRPSGPGVYELEVTGDLGLHGVTRSLTVPVRVEVAGDRLVATGRMTVRHDDFGMKPVSAGAGTVKVKNEVEVAFRLVALSRPR
ncbi:MAG TPA: YceI family protein [Vicinamibacteria bacterium]|nr:YceI family protein [Vicinamibacteria bacterium]